MKFTLRNFLQFTLGAFIARFQNILHLFLKVVQLTTFEIDD